MDISEFKPIAGFDGKYLIDREGNILSMYRYRHHHKIIFEEPILLHPMVNVRGYKWVSLYNDNEKGVVCTIHRLVALTFLDNPENKKCVCHKDNNKLNCSVENLYWGTVSENMTQAINDGLIYCCPVAKLDSEGNILNVYSSQVEARRLNNFKTAHIHECVIGKRKKTHGYKWKQLTREEYEYYVNLKK